MPSSGGQTCALDRKSTRLNSSHGSISYAVFCLQTNIKTNRHRYMPSTHSPLRYVLDSSLHVTIVGVLLVSCRYRASAELYGLFLLCVFKSTPTSDTDTLALRDPLPI